MDPLLLQGDFWPVINIVNLEFELATVTLRIRSRSNGWPDARQRATTSAQLELIAQKLS
jgi:hypothetical protein